MMKSEQWSFIDTFVKQEHDWSFLTSSSAKVNTGTALLARRFFPLHFIALDT
jgi:hypothetical protein